MKEQLISFETAVLAKEKGFNIFCGFIYPLIDFMSYEEDKGREFKEGTLYEYTFLNKEKVIFAPTQSLLQKWLIEKHFIFVEISLNFCPKSEIDFGYGVCVMSNINKWNNVKWFGLDITGEWYKSYELALETGLQEALKLIN